MNKTFFIILLSLILLTSCFKFGENIALSGKEIKAETVQRIENQSKIKFPKGTSHLRYLYFGDTIDPYWLYKGQLTAEGYKLILTSNEFSKLPDKSENDIYIQNGMDAWWHPHAMESKVSKKYIYPNGSLLTYSIGKENGNFMVYISYHTM